MEITASLADNGDTQFTIDGMPRSAMHTLRFLQDSGLTGRQADALCNAARDASPEVMAKIEARRNRRAG